jgi:hypothetical protein
VGAAAAAGVVAVRLLCAGDDDDALCAGDDDDALCAGDDDAA